MLKNIDWPKTRQYKSGSNREPIEFYLEALSNSNSLDLLLGYFSFSAINVLSLGFARFLYNGGKLRVIANQIFSAQDKETLLKANEPGRSENGLIDLNNIESLRFALDGYGQHFFQCLAWLIANKRIELVIVKPKGKQGIAHYKSGVFKDGKENVRFKASCNFTTYGLMENLEELDVDLGWEDLQSEARIIDQKRYYEEIFSGKARYVEYIPPEQIEVAIRDKYGDKDIQELLVEEAELLRMKSENSKNPKIRRFLRKLENEVDEISRQPKFPYPSGPREYQDHAYENWKKNGKQGIFAMATGTGKTITSLNCVLNEHLKSNDRVYNALILVPTITLVEQWTEEAKNFNFHEIISVSSKSKWEPELATTLSTAKRTPTSFIVIATYASFIRERFHKYIHKFPKDTIFIADEAHNIGARSVLDKLNSIQIKKRIALSATPKRIYDPEGTRALESFFNDSEPYTYTFSMDRAINEAILCKYDYHPHLVELTNEELLRYAEITKKIARVYASKNDSLEGSEIVERLLLQRKRIVHKAQNKLNKTIEILQERYAENNDLRYTFIYVPEGHTETVLENDQGSGNEEVDLHIIRQYTQAIGRIDPKILVNQFISGMSDRNEILDQFKKGRIQVLASMKCLDEGVDIPRAEHAIFCSSTGNPRQFIQRRGRILRRHPEKHKAVIHDLIVIPNISQSHKGSDTFELERTLVRKELERVMYFASLSENPYETEDFFQETCDHYDLNIYTIYNELKGT